MKSKFASESKALMTELVLPNDTNTLGNLMGGKLMHWMDIVGAIAAMRHSNRICVTAGVDNIDFKSNVRLGEMVILEASVTRAFTSSMEIRIDVESENLQTGLRTKCNTAYFTFVAVDQAGNPIPVNTLIPETEREKALFDGALRRRELRLVVAGRLKPKDAQSLIDLFAPENIEPN